MNMLIADKFEASGLAGLRALGLHGHLRAAAQGCGPRRRPGGERGAGPHRPVDARHRGDARRRSAVAHRSCRCRRQHDRRRGGVAPRHLRLELPGQERRGGGRAGVRADARARPARRGQRRRPAPRRVEQEGILQGARPLRPDARAHRLRQHRAGGGAPRPCVRHAGDRLEPALRRGRGDPATGRPGARHRGGGDPGGSRRAGRRRQRASRADQGHTRPGRP